MPRERVELFRLSNARPKEKIIVLAYEGNNTEPQYFEAIKEHNRFNDDLIYLVSLRRSKTDTNSAPRHVFNKLKRESKDEYNFASSDELWMIIDRDRWPNIQQIFTFCQDEGNFYLALSNPCFEFWLLLHLKDIKDFTENELKLIFRNRKVSSKKTYLKQLIGKLLPDGYNESKIKPERFLPAVDDAIYRAKTLDDISEDYPTKLGSHVYKLVDKLLT